MGNTDLKQIIDQLAPEEALEEMSAIIKELFPILKEQARLDFVMNLIGDADTDKVSSLVHL